MNIKITIPLILGFWLSWSVMMRAQDIHYTQYDFAPMYLNPAQTGLYNGDYRVVANFRDQWFSVPVPYMTFSTSFDAHLLQNKLENNVLAIGGLFHYDRAGDIRLSLTHVTVNLAYHQQLAKGLFLGAGIQVGIGQRRFRSDLATFDDQFRGDVFDPSYTSADLANLTKTGLTFLDIGTGINLRYQKTARTWMNTGLALVHLNNPKQSFMGQDVRLKMRMSVSANASFQVNERWDIVPTLLYQWQKPYQEFLFGALTRYHLNQNPGRETAVFFGSEYRLGDAVAAIFGINYQTWQLGFSYDVNTSKFNAATNSNGGFELSLIHIWKKVPNLPMVKTCPIF
jgi:type IX secretion system PorP/SprF family membrane protein